MYGHLRTSDAVNPAPGLVTGFVVVTLVYAVLTVVTLYVMRLIRWSERPVAPQEPERTREPEAS